MSSEKLKALLGVELPIIQAPMAGVQDSALAVAVSSVGGLGSLPCAMLSAEDMQRELTKIQAQTKRPFNVNFFCHPLPCWNEKKDVSWRESLTPYFEEYEVGNIDYPTGPSRMPFSHEMADVIENFKPKIVSFHFGLPEPGLLNRVKAWGAKVIASATTVEEAVWLEKKGCDAIIAQGIEAGGHRGMFLTQDLASQTSTFTLLKNILNEVKVPVIAAGGIVDAKDVCHAIELGAIAVQVGTAYLLCSETKTSHLHRDKLKSLDAHNTAITNVFSGRPARGIVNRAMRELGPISPDAPEFPLASNAMALLRSKAEKKGSGDFSPLWCGTNVSGCKEISASQLTLELALGITPN